MKPPKDKPPPKLERLTAERSRSFLLMPMALGGGFALFAICEMFDRKRQHQRVKDGAEIWAQVQPLTQVPLALSILVAGALTALAAVASIGAFFLFRTATMTFTGMVIFCGVNFFLWLMVAFLWYRCFTPTKAVTVPVHTIAQEGVWPPTPSVSQSESDDGED